MIIDPSGKLRYQELAKTERFVDMSIHCQLEIPGMLQTCWKGLHLSSLIGSRVRHTSNSEMDVGNSAVKVSNSEKETPRVTPKTYSSLVY